MLTLARLPAASFRRTLPLLNLRKPLSTRRLTVTDVLKQTSKLRIGKAELKALQNGQSDEIPKRRNPKVQDVEKIFGKRPKSEGKNPLKKSKKLRGPNKQSGRSLKKNADLQRNVGGAESKVVIPSKIPFKQAKELHVEHIPKLAHKLDRVLFSPGVQFLQDPRTRIYNYDPHLASIVHIDDFDFSKIQGFVTVSKDETLLKEAIRTGKTFYSSTLSMTLTLHQFYLFLNNYTETSRNRFDFPPFSRTCTTLPLSVIIEPKGVNPATDETIYSVSSDKSADVEILLGAMGHCLEVMLTTSPDEFQKYLKETSEKRDETEKEKKDETEEEKRDETEKKDEANAKTKSENTATEKTPSLDAEDPDPSCSPTPNVYNYLTCGEFLMRSQLDCYDLRLPGNGTFDLKTRAVCAIRHDRNSDASESTYQIWKLKGQYESFEREYNDLIRTGALLKYGFQARIGQMDGILVAYHNVRSFFGFQYIPLLDIDQVFYSDKNVQRRVENNSQLAPEAEDELSSVVAESQFKVSLAMWQDIMNSVIADLKGTKYEKGAFRLVLKRKQTLVSSHPTRKTPVSILHVYAVPLESDTVAKFQQFSDRFETSFRAEISNAERAENLKNYQTELDKFNGDVATHSPVLKYTVRVDVSVDATTLSGPGRHPFPPSAVSAPAYKYSIRGDKANSVVKTSNHSPPPKLSATSADDSDPSDSIRNQYLSLMKAMSSTLTMAVRPAYRQGSGSPSLVDQMRRYSAVGKRRRTNWHQKENPPQRFSPHEA